MAPEVDLYIRSLTPGYFTDWSWGVFKRGSLIQSRLRDSKPLKQASGIRFVTTSFNKGFQRHPRHKGYSNCYTQTRNILLCDRVGTLGSQHALQLCEDFRSWMVAVLSESSQYNNKLTGYMGAQLQCKPSPVPHSTTTTVPLELGQGYMHL